LSFALPGGADLTQEVTAGRRGFVEDLVASVAVVADGGSRHEHLGLASQLANRVGQVPRAQDAAVADAGLLGGGPAAGSEGLAGEVEDDINVRECVQRCGLLLRVPRNDLYLASQSGPGRRRVPRQHDGTFQP